MISCLNQLSCMIPHTQQIDTSDTRELGIMYTLTFVTYACMCHSAMVRVASLCQSVTTQSGC